MTTAEKYFGSNKNKNYFFLFVVFSKYIYKKSDASMHHFFEVPGGFEPPYMVLQTTD